MRFPSTRSPQIIMAEDLGKELDVFRFSSDGPSADCPGGDCACPTISLSTSFSQAELDGEAKYVADFSIQPLDQEYTVCYNSRYAIALLNHYALDIALQFAVPRTFQDVSFTLHDPLYEMQVYEVIYRLIACGLLRPVDHRDTNPNGSSDTLTAWLHITDRCNLRCDYCYLPHLPTDMSIETGRAAIDATIRSAMINGYQIVKLKYAGGEPMLRFSSVVDLHRYAQEQSSRHGLALEGVILSNGTLLNVHIAETIKGLDLQLMLSLDGMGALHDAQRPYAGGRGSFTDVVNAVSLAIQCGITPYISITVSGRNVSGLKDVVAWVCANDLPFSLNFYRENNYSASHTDLQLEEQTIIDEVTAAYRVIEANPPRRSLLASLVDRANLLTPHVHTCGVGHSYLVFDYRGRVAKCQMHIGKPVTNVSVVDPLSVVRADTVGIQNLRVDEKEGCRTCEWRYWCTGGCPLATFRATGRYDVQSPNCNIYKALFPLAVRLEGLRLLKYYASN
jgi:uncharacterized protein